MGATLISFTGFTIWLFYGMLFFSVLTLRYRNKNVERSYTVPLPFPVICLLVSIFMTVSPIIADPQIEYLVVCGIISTGIIIYIPLIYYNISLGPIGRFLNRVEAGLQLLFVVAPLNQ